MNWWWWRVAQEADAREPTKEGPHARFDTKPMAALQRADSRTAVRPRRRSCLAGDDDRAGSAEELERVRAALEAKGYSDVHDLEVDDGRFEVDARNPQGKAVDLELDLKTLEILHEDVD